MSSWMMAMLLGIVVASFLPFSSDVLNSGYFHLAGLLSAFLLFFACRLLTPRVRLPILFFAVGLAIAGQNAYLSHQSLLLAEHEGELTEIEGVVTGLPRAESRYGKRVQLFEMDVTRTRWQISDKAMRRVKLSWPTEERIHAGQYWRLRAKLKRPRGFANPGVMDYQLYLHQQRIDATGHVRWGEKLEFQPASTNWHGWLSRQREHLGQKLSHATSHLASARFIRALAIGDGAALSAPDWQVLSRTGTTHLFVISGLHVGMLAALSYLLALLLCRCLTRPLPMINAITWASFASLFCAISYAALAGFSLPTQRAVVMLFLIIFARIHGRQFGLANVLLLAVLLLAVWQPLAVRSAGYWLSFIAVSALMFSHSHRLAAPESRFYVGLKVQLVCAIALSPLLLVFFQSTSWVMPAINLLVVPVVSIVVVPIVLLMLFLSGIAIPLPPVLPDLLDQLISAIWRLLEYCATFAEQGAVAYHAPNAAQLISISVAVIIVLSPAALRRPLIMLLPVCLLPWLPAVWTGHSTSMPDADCPIAEFAVLDVGQGLAAVFSAGERTLVFDTGARFSRSFDAGSGVVAPYLRARGRSLVNTLIVSHQDLDHAGGVAGLNAHFLIEETFTSFEATNVPTPRRCTADLTWRWNNIEFEFLSPGDDPSYRESSKNNGSCVLKISAPGFGILLPGDIESSAERELIMRDRESLKADIVVMPHHGSKTSSSGEFVAAVEAKYAIASAAYKGRFKHPHATVLDTYTEAGTKILNTAISGAVEFRLPVCSTNFAAKPELYRRPWGNYWLAW